MTEPGLIVLVGILRRRAVRRLEDGVPVSSLMLPPGAMPMPPTCAAQRVGQVVAVQIRRREHVELVGARQDLLEHDVGDRVLDDHLPAPRLRPGSAPRSAVTILSRELVFATS